MRLMVSDVLSYLAAGDSVEEILLSFPELEHEDILACLAFATEITKLNSNHIQLS